MIKYKVEEKVNENGMGLGVVSWVPQEMGSLDPASAQAQHSLSTGPIQGQDAKADVSITSSSLEKFVEN